jgi:hypothetical protein
MLKDEEQNKNGVLWKPIYGIDQELEQLFRDVEGRTSNIAFVHVYTNLIIDDKELQLHSAKTNVNDSTLSHQKSARSFGPIGNGIYSISTGTSLFCHVNHHGESSKVIFDCWTDDY